jgi:antitoxin component of MazEF toxin-antitoxin module
MSKIKTRAILSSHHPIGGWGQSRIYRQIADGEELGVDSVSQDNAEDDVLKAPGIKALEEWKKKAKELERQNKQLQQKYSGINPEEIEKLRQDSERAQQEELEKQSQYQAALRLKEDKYNQDVEAVRNENQKLQQRLEATLIEQAVVDAFLGNGGRRGDTPKAYAKLLLPAIADQLRVEDGEVIVVDKNGDLRLNPETFQAYTLADLMADCRGKGATAIFFEPQDRASGAGAQPNSRRVSTDKMAELNNLPRAERIARAREMGLL